MPEDWIHLPDSVVAAADYDALAAENAAPRSRLAKLQGGEACCVTHGEGACQLTCAKCNDELRSRLADLEAERAPIVARAENAEAALEICDLLRIEAMNAWLAAAGRES
jgi:hypothetical protein